MHHHLAAHQMGEKLTVGFPDQWRENLVEATPEPRASLSVRHRDLEQFPQPMLTRLDEAL